MEIISNWRFDALGNAIHVVYFRPVYGHSVCVHSYGGYPSYIKTRSCAYVRSL